MKILICGKGGAGKSALTLLMARTLSKKRRVYILDSDESNRLLPRMLGVEAPKSIADFLGGRNGIGKSLKNFEEEIKLFQLPEAYRSTTTNGISLATVGKIMEYGEGCACPFGFLSKLLLKRITLDEDEVLLVDVEAGVEHLGRGVEEGCDYILVVVDPTAEGIEIARLLKGEAERIGKTLHVIMNKVTPDIEGIIVKKLEEVGLKALGSVRFDEEIFRSCLEGGPLQAGNALIDIEHILQNLHLSIIS